MSEQLKYDTVQHPDGRLFKVSTIRTLAGGGGNNRTPGMLSESDYLDETPWPYETMIFKQVGVAGQYHAPSASKAAALVEHARAVFLIREGAAFEGVGVRGFWGTPSMTREEWFARCNKDAQGIAARSGETALAGSTEGKSPVAPSGSDAPMSKR